MKLARKIIDFITVCALFGIFVSVCAMAYTWKITFAPCTVFIISALWIGLYAILYKIANK